MPDVLTKEQLDRFLALIAESRSPRPPHDEEHKDYNRFVFLRGWNEGLDHALMCLNKAIGHTEERG